MEEIYQVTSALKHLPWGKQVAVVTDARFSGVSTGACIGHVSPEALAGGPIGKLRDNDRIRIVIDRVRLEGSVDFVETDFPSRPASSTAGTATLARRAPRTDLQPDRHLPDDTKLWAALQNASGGVWAGCVYDAAAISTRLASGQ
jgi:dihydroxyacid dehydratase/phosphogluconate dehydratase